jgi:hypothetical protein
MKILSHTKTELSLIELQFERILDLEKFMKKCQSCDFNFEVIKENKDKLNITCFKGEFEC